MPEHQQTNQSKESKSTAQKQATRRIQAPISHPASIIQRARINPKSLTHADVMQLQSTIGNRAVVRLLSEIGLIPSKAKQAPPVQMQTIPEEEKKSLQGKFESVSAKEIPEEEEPLQGKFESGHEKKICPSCIQRQEIPEEEEPLQGKMGKTIQLQEIPEEEEPLQGKFESIQHQEIPDDKPFQTKMEDNTGIPDNLKAGVESLSGIDMSDVRVHYNSDKPANVGALAYTQGTNIHVAPGQERHLPHEVWHVVQQVQGRVKPTIQLNDVTVNNDVRFEREADVMGMKAVQMKIGNRGGYPSTLTHQTYMNPFASANTDLILPKKTNGLVCQFVPAFELYLIDDEALIKYIMNVSNVVSFNIDIDSEADASRLLDRLNKLPETVHKQKRFKDLSSFLQGITIPSDPDTLREWVEKAGQAAESTKIRKPQVRRHLYLGNGLLINLRLGKAGEAELKVGLDPATKETDPRKVGRRKEKTLMVPDKLWTWGINVAWLEKAVEKKAVFKLILHKIEEESPVLKMLNTPDLSKQSFLKEVYSFYSKKTSVNGKVINDDFWYGDEERFSHLTEELAILLDHRYTLMQSGNFFMVPEKLDYFDPKFPSKGPLSPKASDEGAQSSSPRK